MALEEFPSLSRWLMTMGIDNEDAQDVLSQVALELLTLVRLKKMQGKTPIIVENPRAYMRQAIALIYKMHLAPGIRILGCALSPQPTESRTKAWVLGWRPMKSWPELN